ncbi:FAD dependent oxidoreductase [Sarocladium strictum]
MNKEWDVVVVGAGVFGLTTALELAVQGYASVTVLDRYVPPVPDGSSVDISRVIRFDYADDVYLNMAYEAYQQWSQSPKYKDVFVPAPVVMTSNHSPAGRSYVQKTTDALDRARLPWARLESAEETRHLYPTLSGALAGPDFMGYHNQQAGWADAQKAIAGLRDECIIQGVSFVSGRAGTVIGFDRDASGTIRAGRTLAGTTVAGDLFILAAGAWSASLVPMHNSTLSTGQVIAYMRLTPVEMTKYQQLPIYVNFATGWFNFPPHQDTSLLKIVVHGWGYERAPNEAEREILKTQVSMPPLAVSTRRKNFVPSDGERRLRDGLRELLPELADRPFEQVAMCWYTDTPTGDFIMDYHPDYRNLFIAGGGSGHGFKFLPVMGKYTTLALQNALEPALAQKWRFRTEYKNVAGGFPGDGSRGGPEKRQLSADERAKL